MIPALADLDAWLATREAAAPRLRPDCEARVLWAEPGRPTPWSVVYVHGFSASRREASPWPERVAAALGANLFSARLTGHGQDGAAMDRATLADWRRDTAEALAIGRALGRRLLVLSCSTGSTLVTGALAGGDQADASAMLSPHFGLADRGVQLALDAPFSARWAPWVVRGSQSPPAASAASGIWTSGYTARAYPPMAQAVRAVRRADLGAIAAPGLFLYSPDDRVVAAPLTEQVMSRWGGRTTGVRLRAGPGDDPASHVLAGDALSPGLTDRVVAATLDWARAL